MKVKASFSLTKRLRYNYDLRLELWNACYKNIGMKIPDKQPAKVNATWRIRPEKKKAYDALVAIKPLTSKILSEKIEKFIDELAKDNLAAS